MSPTVVYVHGIGNKPPAAALKNSWDIALFGAPAGARSVMAYWADLRYPRPLPDAGAGTDELVVPEASAEGMAQEGVAQDSVDPRSLVVETLAEVRASAEESPAGAGDAGSAAPDDHHLDAWLREMAYVADAVVAGAAAESATGLAPSAERAAPPAGPGEGAEALWLPRPGRKAVFRELVKRTFVDVYAYFFGGDGSAIRSRLRTKLDAIDGPVVVIGHSLGSVVAYDVLCETTRDVPLFVTIGSPLAVTEIQDLVARPLRVPKGVAAWRNVADGRDLVALDRTIRPEFAPPDRVTDFLVVNDSSNHHGGRQYLASAPVRSAVTALMR